MKPKLKPLGGQVIVEPLEERERIVALGTVKREA